MSCVRRGEIISTRRSKMMSESMVSEGAFSRLSEGALGLWCVFFESKLARRCSGYQYWILYTFEHAHSRIVTLPDYSGE